MRHTYGLMMGGVVLVTVATASWDRPVESLRGPPWLSIELPANPLDQDTRGAAAVVHVYHHERPAVGTMRGRAEGLVDGERRSIPLEFTRTSREGVYAIPQAWPSEGEWVLAISGSQDATLLVHLGRDGGFTARRYYGQATHLAAVRTVQVLEGESHDRVIERMLRSAVTASEDR